MLALTTWGSWRTDIPQYLQARSAAVISDAVVPPGPGVQKNVSRGSLSVSGVAKVLKRVLWYFEEDWQSY